MKRVIFWVFLATIAYLAAPLSAAVGPVALRAAPERAPLTPGSSTDLIVEMTVARGYHAQSATPHDRFLIPTKVTVGESAGITAGVVRFPEAKEIRTPAGTSTFPTMSVYEGTVYFKVPVTVSADATPGARTIKISVRTQVCDDRSCLPPKTQEVPVEVTIAPAGTETNAPDAALAEAAGKQKYVTVEAASAPATTRAADTMPAAGTNAAVGEGTAVTLLSVEEQVRLVEQRPYKAFNRSEQDYSLGWIVLFALVGGAILNIMPCVLPVIPLKVLSLVQQAHGDRRLAVLHGLTFSAGVVTLFVALAILLKIGGLFYGQQFQSPAFLIAMALFVVALALSMLGVWTINPPQAVYNVDVSGGAAGGEVKHAHLASFTNGLMATLLATPCSAPYLGPVLAWAFVQPMWLTALALGLVGVGMSLPYLVLAAFPAGLNKLPRAGRWSELLKQFLGIVMLGVAVYLITLVPNVTYWPWVLMGAVLVGVVCWAWGQIPTFSMPLEKIWTIRVASLVIGGVLGWGLYAFAARATVVQPTMLSSGQVVMLPKKSSGEWMAFNTALLDEALKEGRPVVVDWTADWCINCRALETFVLSTEQVRSKFIGSNAVLLRGDLSNDNPPVDALNKKLGGQAIPVLAIFSPGRPYEPVVLRDSYTSARVVGEVESAR